MHLISISHCQSLQICFEQLSTNAVRASPKAAKRLMGPWGLRLNRNVSTEHFGQSNLKFLVFMEINRSNSRAKRECLNSLRQIVLMGKYVRDI